MNTIVRVSMCYIPKKHYIVKKKIKTKINDTIIREKLIQYISSMINTK